MDSQVSLPPHKLASALRNAFGAGSNWLLIRIAGVLLTLSGLVAAAQEVPCQVDSTHDGNGLFTYTFRRGSVPYVWGLATNSAGEIAMQSYGILEIVDPPGWTHSVSPGGWIRWSVTNGIVYLDEPVTFSVRSCLAETATYDYWWPPGPYPLGVIGGVVFELPGRTNQLGGGYQNFTFTGPALPTLAIEWNNSDIILRWSTLSQRCQLEAADQLHPQAIWNSVTNVPVVVGTSFNVALPQTDTTKFFRLVTPAVQIP